MEQVGTVSPRPRDLSLIGIVRAAGAAAGVAMCTLTPD